MPITTYLWIAAGSAIGGTLRFWLSSLTGRIAGGAFPWGTLLVNATGSFAIGLFAALTVTDPRLPASPELRTFEMVGLCGGYTTFSSFSLQTLTLAEDGDWLRAGLNIVLSLVLCLAAVSLGSAAAGLLNSAGGT